MPVPPFQAAGQKLVGSPAGGQAQRPGLEAPEGGVIPHHRRQKVGRSNEQLFVLGIRHLPDVGLDLPKKIYQPTKN